MTGPIAMKLGPALKLRAMLARKLGACTVCLHCAHCHQTPLPVLNATANATANINASGNPVNINSGGNTTAGAITIQTTTGRRPSSTGN